VAVDRIDPIAAGLPRPPLDQFDDPLRRAGTWQVQKHLGPSVGPRCKECLEPERSSRKSCERERTDRRLIDTMSVLVGALIIIFGALAVAAIHEFASSKMLAVFLQLVLLAAVVGIFLWLR
jgi:hypothetical protein